jgi:lipoprotein-anchoring transpeptidase ErfK/SrfK
MIPAKNAVWDFKWLRRIYLYLRRANPRRVVLFLGTVCLVLMLVVLLGFLLVQDVASSDRIFEGAAIDGMAVGGLSRAQATLLVQEKVAAPLAKPLTLFEGKNDFRLSPQSIGLSIDIDRMVDRAYWAGHGKIIFERMFRRFFNKPVRVNVPVILKYDKAKLDGFVADVASDLDYPARSASIDMSKGSPVISHSRNGLKVNQPATTAAIVAALPRDGRRIPIVYENVKPKLTEGDIGVILVVKQGEHKLYQYRGETLEDTYAVAVGSPQYPTPTGVFEIAEKKKDPWWYPPKADWAKGKKPIPPGPGNPLGPYWMGLGSDIGIHSTPDEASLGYSVSHGCIRMSEWSAMQLFKVVKKGTPVYIYP